jgi:hypothetical protein
MNKNIKIYSLCLIVLMGVLFSSCDKGFKEINTSVDFVSTPNLDYELPFIELTMLDKNYYTLCRNVAAYVSHVDNRYDFQRLIAPDEDYMGEHFKWIYQNPMRIVVDYIGYAKQDPEKINYLSIGRILKVYLAHQLTDVYGDIPYFESNKGYTDQIIKPNYDPQQKIYEDMFKELTEANQAFDNAKPIPVLADIVYKGEIAKWKKFSNSLMLRLGLRIMKVDPVNGKKYIDQAIAGGLITSNADNFVVKYQPNSNNTTTGNGAVKVFVSSSYVDRWRLASAFVDSLKNRNDPRTTVYCMLPTAPFTSFHDGDHTFEKQRGIPQFGGGLTESRNNFSTSNFRTFARYDAPYVHLSYAQVQFQLAECVVRGIITTGNAKTYYENGVRASMSALSIYGADGVISSAQQDAYLLANPYDPANALKMINTQYWIETHYNWYETWANMRRSGHPDTYSAMDKTIPSNFGAELPRKLLYPASEVAANPHVQDAIARQGPEVTTTRVWWDKP